MQFKKKVLWHDYPKERVNLWQKLQLIKVPTVPGYWLRLTGIFNYERIPNREKPIKASCRVIQAILVDIPILLLPTPSRIFVIRWAHTWALRLINNANMNQLSKWAIKNIRQLKNLLIGLQNLSVNAQTAKGIVKVDTVTVMTKIDCLILM